MLTLRPHGRAVATAMRRACAAPPAPALQNLEAKATAAWIRECLQGGVALPLPILNQLACCLYGSGYCADFNEAKAIIAVELRSPLVV